MKKIYITIITLALAAASCTSEKWQFSVNTYDLRTAQITAQGSAHGRAVQTALSVVCRPGKDGTISINYTVYNPDTVEGFNFDSFEGPYAPASSKKLVDIDVTTPAGIINIKTAVAGYYTEKNAFAFSASARNTVRSDVRTIAEALMKGAKSIRITVHDMNEQAITIKTEFPALNAQTVIEKTVKGPLKDK